MSSDVNCSEHHLNKMFRERGGWICLPTRSVTSRLHPREVLTDRNSSPKHALSELFIEASLSIRSSSCVLSNPIVTGDCSSEAFRFLFVLDLYLCNSFSLVLHCVNAGLRSAFPISAIERFLHTLVRGLYTMPPSGRRRFSNVFVFLSCFCLFAATASAAQAVLGIDIGTEYIKAALVKPGVPLDIVLTKDSKRKETAALAFKPTKSKVNTAVDEVFPDRIYGGDAVALSARFPGDVFPNLKPLLCLSTKDDVITEYSSRRPAIQLVQSEETGTLGFKSDSFVKEEEAFLVEELLAMELKNIKGNAEIMAGKAYVVRDVVLTVPSFYTVEERRAITTAAELAGLRVLSLISDGLAVGLNYATSRTFPIVNNGGKPEIHLVYDMGAGSTTATLIRFQGRTVKDVGKYNKTIQEIQVLGTSWDRSLGGDALNGLIVDDMIEKMVESPKLKTLGATTKSIKSHGRTMSKLWKEAERIRQVLSANTETQSSMESLYDEDFNFKYKFKRSDFEILATTFASRVEVPVKEVLAAAKLSISDIESVILHGGAVRTPFVQKRLEATIKDAEKVRTNVNSDEAAVFGAAFKAATISPSFRVKEIKAADTAIYPVFMSWSVDGKEKQQKLFVPTSQVAAEKQVSFKNTEDFSFELSQQASSPLKDLPVSSIKTQNLTESVKQLVKLGCEISGLSTRFSLRISPVDGLPEVVSGSVSCEVTEVKKSGGVVDGVKDFLGFGSKKDAQVPLKDDSEPETLEEVIENESSSTEAGTSTTTSSTSSTTDAADEVLKTQKESKKKVETINVGFTTTRVGNTGLTAESLTRIQTRLSAFDASDRARVLREEALNNLEGYTYKIRDILEDDGFKEASTAAQREEIEQRSNDASTWIYGDGVEANQAALKERLDELRKLVNPVIKRKEEKSKRPEEIQKLQDALLQANSMIDLVRSSIDSQVKAESEKAASLSSASEAEAAASSASGINDTSASSSPDASTTTPAPASDDFADLDDDLSSTSGTTSTSSQKESPTPEPIFPTYSEEDLKTLTDKQSTIKSWLEEKIAAQDKLGATDDPAMLSSELSAKVKEMNDAVMDLVMRQVKKPKAGGSSSSKKSKKPSTKKTKTPKAMTIDVAKAASYASSDPSAATGTAAADEPSQGGGRPPPGLFEEITDDDNNDMPKVHRVSKEDIEAAMKAQEQEEASASASASASGEKTKSTPTASKKSKAKPKASAKKAAPPKKEKAKTNGKAKASGEGKKEKEKMEGHSEL